MHFRSSAFCTKIERKMGGLNDAWLLIVEKPTECFYLHLFKKYTKKKNTDFWTYSQVLGVLFRRPK